MNTVKINFGQEEIISRTPALFPYLEFDNNDICHLHPATDSENGCYGKIVSSIKMPSGINLVIYDNTGLISTPVEEDNTYSYSTLMWYYKQYKGHTHDTDTFIPFMEYCIGKFDIDADIDWSECDLVPKYNYLSEVKRLYNEYKRTSLMVEQYNQYKEATGDINCELECLVDKYNRMGGDVIRDYYKNKITESTNRANYLLTLAIEDDLSISMDLCFTSSENDLGFLSSYINFWEPNYRYFDGDFVTYNGRTYLCTGVYETQSDGVTVKDVGTIGKWDTTYEEYVFDDDHFTLLSELFSQVNANGFDIEGTSDSKLRGFRKQRSYMNMGGDIEQPNSGTDWLFYYKIGALGHYETTTDNLGNILIQDGGTRGHIINGYETSLLAYGDIITDITYNETENTITFTYIIGANLKAKLVNIETDDDGNVRYFYDDYEYNDMDDHGVIYTETYNYTEDSDIKTLIDNGYFSTYVSTETPEANYSFIKGVFDTTSTQSTTTTVINGTPVTYQSNISTYTTRGQNTTDALMAPITKLDYLVGVSYNPYVKDDVFVSRGNAAAWERHIKLGEVKTFADLENYSNGGFFNLISN